MFGIFSDIALTFIKFLLTFVRVLQDKINLLLLLFFDKAPVSVGDFDNLSLLSQIHLRICK